MIPINAHLMDSVYMIKGHFSSDIQLTIVLKSRPSTSRHCQDTSAGLCKQCKYPSRVELTLAFKVIARRVPKVNNRQAPPDKVGGDFQITC